MTELTGAVQECYIGRNNFKGEVILLGAPTIQLKTRDIENLSYLSLKVYQIIVLYFP